MGYTHYFPQTRDFTDSEWAQIQTGTQQILDYCKTKGIVLQRSFNHKSKPTVNSAEIVFNGREADGCESFVLEKESHEEFQFCKTGRKPYDLAVGLVLLYVVHVAADAISLSSDGEWDSEWCEIRQAYREIFKTDPPMIETI